MPQGAPDKQEVEEKEKRLRESIAKNYSHIKNVETQLAQLQLQLNLTSGPKKSALEMLRKKIEAKNEQVVTARQNFLSAQKAAEQAEESLRCQERSKEQLCQELHLLVHQSATAELNKLEQLTRQLDQLNGGTMGGQSAADMPALGQARQAAATRDAPSAQDAAAATTEQQALAAVDKASTLQASNKQDGPATQSLTRSGQSSKKASAQLQPQLVTSSGVISADPTKQVHDAVPAQQPVKKKSNQPRKQLQGSQELTAANDSVGRFVGFQS
ncbi:aci13 [Trebouxia sp. C0009 RCD-2024]